MQLSDNTRGALLMMASMAAFTFNDAFMKSLSGDVPLAQLLFLRGMLTSTVLGLWAWRVGALSRRIPARDSLLLGGRLLAEIGAAYFFVTALFHMPLANLTAILQALPLTVTMGAALFFREPLGWRRLTAIIVGLCGVFLIVRPGAEGFTIYSIYALLSVVCVTIRDLTTRRLSSATPSMLVTFATSLAVASIFGLGAIGETWQPLGESEILRIIGASVMIIGGYHFSVMVMRVGEISYVAPFRYTSLIWALLLGWVLFGDWPRPLTLIGAAIVVSSGIFMLYREGQLARRARRAAKLAAQS